MNGIEVRKTYQDGRGRVIKEVVNGVATDYSYDSKENKLTEVTATAIGGNLITCHIYDEKGNETYEIFTSPGNFIAAVIEEYIDNNLDGKIGV